MNRRSAARCASSLRSIAAERLLRLIALKIGAAPRTNGGPQLRASSPPCGFSIFTTSAPRSARICPANGPATLVPISTTTSPLSASAAVISTDFLVLRHGAVEFSDRGKSV